MVGSILEEKIVGLFADGRSAYSILQISRLLGRSYPHVYNVVQVLLEDHVLLKLVVGNTHLCTVNLDSDKAVILLSLHHLRKRESLRKHELSLLTSLKEAKDLFSTAFLAKGRFYVVTEDKKKAKKRFQSLTCIDRRECSELFVGQNLNKDALVLLGFEGYYDILRHVLDRLPGPLEFLR